MKRKRNIKSAMLASFISVVLCITMLVGSTFAWFTDSVKSGVNKIVAGNLDVSFEYFDGNEYKTVKDSTELFDSTALWEPGYTQTVYLKVKNNGSLNLQYQLSVNILSETEGTNVNGDNFKLSDYLVFGQTVSSEDIRYQSREDAWQAAGDTKGLSDYTYENKLLETGTEQFIALVVYMPMTVSNEANYDKTKSDVPTIDLGVNVVATQTASESDGFDNQYDVGAVESLPAKAIKTIDELKSVQSNSNVKLLNDISSDEDLNLNGIVNIDLNGHTISLPNFKMIDSDSTTKVVISNGTIDAGTGIINIEVPNGTIVLDNVNLQSGNSVILDASQNSVLFKGLCKIDCNIIVKGDTHIVFCDDFVNQNSLYIAVDSDSNIDDKRSLNNNLGNINIKCTPESNNININDNRTSVDDVFPDPLVVYTYEENNVNIIKNSLAPTNIDLRYLNQELDQFTSSFDISSADDILQAIDSITSIENYQDENFKFNLKNDIQLSKVLEINTNLYIKGNGHKITAPQGASRAISINDNNDNKVSLFLDNLIIDASECERCISIYGNDNVTININSCQLFANKYCVNDSSNNGESYITANNSKLIGWCAFQTWSSNTFASFKDCTLIGNNKFDYNAHGWNNFATIVINEDTKNVNLNFYDCVIQANQTTGNIQAHYIIHNGTAMSYIIDSGSQYLSDSVASDCTVISDNKNSK